MTGRDIIVVGASAGGAEALPALAAGLPRDIAASLLVTLPIGTSSSPLAKILNAAGLLPAHYPADGDPIKPERTYVAPPDHQLLVRRGHVHVSPGPRESHTRPAIDPLFRSAAAAYGPRVTGVILSGTLTDGTAGLSATKGAGGVAIVQDPAAARLPEMPRSALRYAPVDRRSASEPMDRG